MDLAEMLPTPDFSERHERLVEATPAETWNYLIAVAAKDLPLTCALMGVRLLPAALSGRAKNQLSMLSKSVVENAPIPLLSRIEGVSILTGGVLQPWKLRGGERPPKLDAAGVKAFDPRRTRTPRECSAATGRSSNRDPA